MPFEKNNKLWQKSVEARKEKKSRIDSFFEMIASGGITEYGEKLSKLAESQELSKPEIEFLDRMDKMVEYVRPKLARNELTGKGGEKLEGTVVYLPSKDAKPDKE